MTAVTKGRRGNTHYHHTVIWKVQITLVLEMIVHSFLSIHCELQHNAALICQVSLSVIVRNVSELSSLPPGMTVPDLMRDLGISGIFQFCRHHLFFLKFTFIFGVDYQ